MQADSTSITDPNSSMPKATTQKDNFKHTNAQSKVINTPLDNFTANNIRTTHFEIGPGGKAKPSENQDQFKALDSKNAN
jgi:hypothetical protein